MDAETEKKEYKYRYPHPAVTADCVVFAFGSDGLEVLLVERGHEPCKGMWAFPGGFLNMDETAEECAKRELREETGLTLDDVHEIGSFSAVHRDPRERVISIAFYALARNTAVKGGDDAAEARWWAVDSLPPLAFDHDDMLRCALKRLRQDLLLEPELFDGQLPAALSFLI